MPDKKSRADRLSSAGHRSRLSTSNAEALQRRLKQAALRDHDLDLEIASDWITTAVGRAGVTTTVKALVALRCWALTAQGLKSVTRVTNRLVLGTWVGTGVQEMMPLASMVALVGPLSRA